MQTKLENIFQFGDSIAVVTGGGGELCGTISSALAALGIKVAILDIDIDKAKQREENILSSEGLAKWHSWNFYWFFRFTRDCRHEGRTGFV